MPELLQQNQLPSLDEFVSSTPDQITEEKQTIPSLQEFIDQNDPEKFTSTEAYLNLKKEQIQSQIPFMGNPTELSNAQRIWAQKQPFWNVVKAFGSGYADQWTSEMEDISKDTDAAMLKNYMDGVPNIQNAFVDGFIVPTAKAAWTTFLSAPTASFQQGSYQLGKEIGGERLGRELAALPEAFPIETAIGLPRTISKAKALTPI